MKTSWFFWGVIGLLLITIGLQFCLTNMAPTGDEPGYIYQSLSFWHTGGFQMPTTRFAQEMPLFQSLANSGSNLGAGHPVALSIIGAPLTGLFGVSGARTLSVLCALIAVIAMACLLRPLFATAIALVATGFVILTFPALAYTHLFYTEMMIMMLVAVSWALGRTSHRHYALLAVLTALLLPFVHVRSAALSPLLVLFALIPLWQRRDWPGLAAAVCLCGLGCALFCLEQFFMFGHLIAGAASVYPPSLDGIFPRLGIQLLEFRHGLLPANPACILAIAGLALGLWRRSSLAIQASVILLVYVPPMIWGTASESWPARYWTPVMPAMAVGMGFWLAYARGLPALLAGAILGLAALLNSFMLLQQNGHFLDNRFADLSADRYSPLHDHFDIAGLLPWDAFDFAVAGIDPAPALDDQLLRQAAAFCVVLVLAFIINGLARAPRWTTWLPVLALLPLFIAISMRPLAASAMAVSQTDQAVVLTFACPAPVRLIRIVTPNAMMAPPAYPTGLEISTVSAKGNHTASWQAPFTPVLGIRAGRYHTIRITAAGPGAAGIWKQADFIAMTAGLQPLRCR